MMEKLLRLSLGIGIISYTGYYVPDSAAEPSVKPRTVRTIPWGADGRPKETRNPSETSTKKTHRPNPTPSIAGHPAPVPTSRPHLSKIVALTGDWCIPDDCDGPTPIGREGFSTCESYCTLSNPVLVRGLDAMLFDVSCKGDWGGRDYRMILKEYEDSEGTRRAAMLTSDGVENLVRCSDEPAPQPDESASQCDFNSRLYQARPGNPDLADQYHELRLVDGYTECPDT